MFEYENACVNSSLRKAMRFKIVAVMGMLKGWPVSN